METVFVKVFLGIYMVFGIFLGTTDGGMELLGQIY